MKKPLVKICGITNFADALFCARAGANFLGFIFYKNSPRYIQPEKAKQILTKIPNDVIPVGVFVNEKRDIIEKIRLETKIRILQLNGDESPDDCLGFPVDVWKAFRFNDTHSVIHAKEYKVSAALLDGVSEGKYGGTGKRVDANIALELKKHHTFVLAGGLSPENIVDAILTIQPDVVDINSGVELVPGKKNQQELIRLFERINQVESI